MHIFYFSQKKKFEITKKTYIYYIMQSQRAEKGDRHYKDKEIETLEERYKGKFSLNLHNFLMIYK